MRKEREHQEGLRRLLLGTLRRQGGVLFAEPAIVCRETYSGRDILAKNSEFSPRCTDARGYVPVEWWIMSVTGAENPMRKEGEGLTRLKLHNGSTVTLRDALVIARKELFGGMGDATAKRWPLTKVLDIGGKPKRSSFSEEAEVPPIPPHIHAGELVNGRVKGPGKREAYFFLPVDIPPYDCAIGRTVTRLGLKAGVTKAMLIERIRRFGLDDSMYELLQPYPAEQYTGWTIREGTVHAPGPRTTLEIQYPQDDFNLLGWRFGERLMGEERERAYRELVLRGWKTEEELVEGMVDWETSTDPAFERNHRRDIEILEEGPWGRRYRIFFDDFYGEGWEIAGGATKALDAKAIPRAAIVWSGAGTVNGNRVAADGERELLVTPGAPVTLKNAGKTPIILFTVEPMLTERPSEKGYGKGLMKGEEQGKEVRP